jgi:hypothetical protein
MRENQLNIRLSDEETERLEAVTQHHGLNGANLFRMLLKREADAVAAIRLIDNIDRSAAGR